MRLKLSQPSLAGVGAGAELGNLVHTWVIYDLNSPNVTVRCSEVKVKK